MANLDEFLKVNRCPHCSMHNPNLHSIFAPVTTLTDDRKNPRRWRGYVCASCGGVVIATASSDGHYCTKIYPSTETLDDVLPIKVKSYLQQAIDSVFAPSGSVMLCASSVDAMLKEKGYKKGTLNSRIKTATSDGLLTKEMELWAHEVRLDANDERHADEEATLPTIEDARQSIEFTKTLAEFLFVLPSKVQRGIDASKHKEA